MGDQIRGKSCRPLHVGTGRIVGQLLATGLFLGLLLPLPAVLLCLISRLLIVGYVLLLFQPYHLL